MCSLGVCLVQRVLVLIQNAVACKHRFTQTQVYISECKTQNSEYVPSIQLTKEEQTSPDHKEALQTGSPISSHGSSTQSTSRAFPQHVGRQTLSGSPNLSNIRPPSIKASSVDLKVLCQFHL